MCIQSTCTQSVICHVVCYAQPQKETISCSFYLPPCFIPPATTAASTWLIYNCILTVELLKILTFYAISVCFWLQKPLKSKNSAELVPLHCVFPLTPYSYWPLLSNSGRSVFTCQRINPAICAISGFLWLSIFCGIFYFILFYLYFPLPKECYAYQLCSYLVI